MQVLRNTGQDLTTIFINFDERRWFVMPKHSRAKVLYYSDD